MNERILENQLSPKYLMKHPYFKLMSGFPTDRIPIGFYPHQNTCLVSHSIFLNRSRMEEYFFCFITPLNSIMVLPLARNKFQCSTRSPCSWNRQISMMFSSRTLLAPQELRLIPLVSQPSSTSGLCPTLL